MSETVRVFYDRSVDREFGRLDSPLCRIEMASTLRLVDEYFPRGSAVCDIGGGPGRYALELTRRGYKVSLFDLSDALLAKASTAFAAEGVEQVPMIQGDARDLSVFGGAMFDGALFLGPLYHITDAEGRQQALAELKRVLKPGGVAIVAYLNSWGLLRTGLNDFPKWYRNSDQMRALLTDRSYSAELLREFTDSYWSTPPSALDEVRRAGFEVPTYAGAEGFCGGMQPIVVELARTDPVAYENVVALAAETCTLPQYRDATDHLHIVLRKPKD